MPNFINSQAEIKLAVGGAVNASFSYESIQASQSTIVQTHIAPLLGDTLMERILEAVDDSFPLHATRIRFVEAVAFLMLADYSNIGAVQLSSAGITRTETENTKSAFRYQEDRYRHAVRAKGYDAIELGLMRLDAAASQNEEVLSFLIDSPAFALTRGRLVVWADQVREFHGQRTDRYTFNTLRPILTTLERQAVVPLLGMPTYTLLMGYVATDKLSQEPEYAHLAELLRESLCLGAVAEAQRRFLVTVADGRVMLREQNGDQSDEQRNAPSRDLLAVSHEHLDNFRDRGLQHARDYLTSLPQAFPEWHAERLAAAVAKTLSPPLPTTTNHGGIVSL